MKQSLKSALKCESCDNKPCFFGCPLNNDIPKFINYIKKEKYEDAYKTLSDTTVLMSVCGRVCPHNRQCEGTCIKNDVLIGKLEAEIGDFALHNKIEYKVPKKTNYNVAVVGSGPAGLTCAAFLRKMGIGVTIYEKYDYLGGLLMHGIPEFRLSPNIVTGVTNNIINMGIDVKYNMELGKNLSLTNLKRKHDAIFIAIGANVSNKMHIEGEKLDGVFGGNEILEYKTNIDWKNKNVVISGGGNVAMDIARTVIRSGAKKVSIIYRRKKEAMSADIKEIKSAIKDGIDIIDEANILRIKGRKKVNAVEIIKTESLVNTKGKIIVKNVEGTNYIVPTDYVIMAIGSHTANVVRKLRLNINSKGKIQIDKNGKTSSDKVFAGGDVAGVKNTVAWAARSGRNSAYAIIEYLSNKG